jgi:hypothetical protein
MQPGRARERQKRVAAVGVSPVLGGGEQCMRREQPDEEDHQCGPSCESFEVIRGHSRSFEVISTPIKHVVIRGHQRSSEVIRAPIKHVARELALHSVLARVLMHVVHAL